MLPILSRRRLQAWLAPVVSQPILMLAAVLLYFVLSRVAALAHFNESPITLLWLPAGFAVALLFRFGAQMLPAIFLGAMAASGQELLFTQSQAVAGWSRALLLSFLFAGLNTLQPWLIFKLFRSFSIALNPLQGERPLLVFFASVLVTCTLTGAGLALAAAPLMQQSVATSWTLFASSDATAIFMLAPAILLHDSKQPFAYLRKHPGEVLLWLLLLYLTCRITLAIDINMTFLLLPLLVWAATRFTPSGSALALLVAGLAMLITPALNHHLSLAWLATDQLVSLHVQLMLMIAVALYLNTLLEDRNRIETSLEDIVTQRTQQLEMTNQELQDEIFIRLEAERSFRTSSRRYRALIETAGSPIIVMDKDFTIRQWNGAAERLFGYDREDIIGKNYVQCFVPKSFQDETAWKITKVVESGVSKENLESEALSFDGSSHTMLWNINRLVDSDEQLTQVIIIGQDITDIRQTQDKLQYLAHYDMLTGVANRRLFEDRCRQAIKSSIRNKYQVGLISLDIDHFKRINDTLGHDAGDLLLKQIAERLMSCLRKEDTIARLGGDEFAVLLSQVNGPEGAELVARNILDKVVEPISLPGQELVITTSIGITIAPTDGIDYNSLLKNADMAMYRAKKAGRNNIQFFRAEMNEELQRQLQLEQELRVALQEHQFAVYYQPVIDLENGRIIGLEALLRWHHPTRGLLGPKDFLKVAEQSGLLPSIGEWVLYNTCLQGKAVQAMSSHPVQVSINLSQRQFQHPSLVDTVRRVISETLFNPRFVALEISENTVATHPEEAIDTLNKLREVGVALTIDSFGSGFSSLTHLSRLPVESIKIDRRFINGIPDQDNAVAITETLLTIAQKMGLRVIVEGIEKEDQEAFFRRYNCRYVQGHLYSQPIPDTALPQLFHALKTGQLSSQGKQIGLPL